MTQTISALTKNSPGVLADMAQAIRKYNVNIRSISAGETEDPTISRLTIGLDGSEDDIQRITEEMADMDVIISMDDLRRKEFVDRELVLVKVAMESACTTQIMQIFEVFRANVVGMGQRSITVEMSGDRERVDGLIKMLAPFGIKSLCRSGMIALKRGDD
ncbi:acetolactate synthase, small subunit [Desulfonatronum thiosulfatophilum]|uniref:Acetolactate synthase small subunit n=1 Tax=Desulfonatronum thiosulfatophilum TaxID=617002 RepID=A0A1G6BJF0_9BACT|nr:acetolactate synthase small subunit [Desulfonatronum thiosulfatophilum]SDB20703.1 acetolactate synthase, small subunit [Desulfonatronum thiosulfatophilum]